MDEDFEAIYRTEQRMKQLFISFSVLAIVIACLGLFGLTAYAAEQRNKEIAIRKVIGASTGSIINIMSADFIKTGWRFHSYSFTVGLVCHEQMAAGFCIPDQYRCFRVFNSRCYCAGDCRNNHQFSIYQGGFGQPGEQFAGRLGMYNNS